MQLNQNQQQYVSVLLQSGALRFGTFLTKSGRSSPYFFDSGALSTGTYLPTVGELYAKEIHALFGRTFDSLFGPAYKGITLAAATAMALARLQGREIPFRFNRKEAKDHGEGGAIVGQPVRPGERVIIIEDVITGGTSLRESIPLLSRCGASVVGVMVGVDREETGSGTEGARQEVESKFGVRVGAIVGVHDIVSYLAGQDIDGKRWIDEATLVSIQTYQREYGSRQL